jgi:hypothetical protein
VGYKALIEGQVKKAFNLVKDLAIVVPFTKVTSAAFDFASGTVSNASSTVLIKVVEAETKKPSKDSSTVIKTFMAKGKDLVDLTLYDSLVYQGQTWKLGKVVKGDGYIWIFEVNKEG